MQYNDTGALSVCIFSLYALSYALELWYLLKHKCEDVNLNPISTLEVFRVLLTLVLNNDKLSINLLRKKSSKFVGADRYLPLGKTSAGVHDLNAI